MSSQLWIDPTFGASGDMLLGAFAGLLDDPEGELAGLDQLGLDGYEIEVGATIRNGLTSTRVQVTTSGHEHGRSWSVIDRLLVDADLPERVSEGARRSFRRLGEVEAAQHGVEIDDVHFHEVGAVDAIVDIVGVWLLFEALSRTKGPIATVVVAPVGIGHGTVEAAHGTLPLPAPATMALLEGCPVRRLDHEGETCTPTGAVLLTTLATEWGQIPNGRPGPAARGAGKRNPSTHPNVVSAVLVEGGSENSFVEATLIETNVDDVTPEVLAHTIDRLLSVGADDAWVVPVVMKKGRPGHEIRVLCRPDLASVVRSVLVAETGSLGSRTSRVDKEELQRSSATVELRGEAVSIKVGPHGAKPEHDDLVALAASTGIPIRLLAIEAIEAWHGQSDPHGR